MHVEDPSIDKSVRPAGNNIVQALIDAAVAQNRELKNVLTETAVKQYMVLPDSSFGWSHADPMPEAIKALVIVTTLSLGLIPGLKQVIWVGNGVYITAEARAYLISRSPDVSKSGSPTYRLFTEEEKQMFRVGETDMHCAIVQKVKSNGNEFEWIGHGIIDAIELDRKGPDGKPYPGFQSKTSIAQTLKTRAERDMHRRGYPVGGLPDVPDASELADYQGKPARPADPVQQPQQPTPPPALNPAFSSEQVSRFSAFKRYESLASDVRNRGADVKEILGDEDFIASAETAERLHDAADVLQEWLERPQAEPVELEQTDPDPEPPTPPPTKASKPAKPAAEKQPPAKPAQAAPAPEQKRGRGRPPKNPPQPQTPQPQAAAPAHEDDEPEANELALMPEKNEADDVYNATDAQKEMIRVAAENAGLVADSLKHAIAGALKGRPMSDLPKVVEALSKSVSAQKPAPAPAVDTDAADALRQKAIERLRSALKNVEKNGGKPMQILGSNPYNAIDSGDFDEIQSFADQLENWRPGATAAEETPKPIPTSGPGVKAYETLSRYLHDAGVSANVRARISRLMDRQLRDGDHLFLPKALREARGGNFGELDKLISERSAR